LSYGRMAERPATMLPARRRRAEIAQRGAGGLLACPAAVPTPGAVSWC